MKFSRSVCLGIALLMLGGTVATSAAAYESARESREPRKAQKGKAAVVVAKYPQATRGEPKIVRSSKVAAKMKKVIDAFNDDKFDQAIEAAEQVLAESKATDYERGTAAQIAAFAWNSKDADNSYAESIRFSTLALGGDALPNNDHFDLLFMQAQLHLANEKYDEAVKAADRFIAETKSDEASIHALRGNALYRLDRFPEAVESLKKAIAIAPKPDKSWTQMLMASYFEMDQPVEAAKLAEQIAAESPGDKSTLLNLANIYLQADQPEKAGEVFDRLHSQGLLTESKDYDFAYRLLANIDGREQDAIAIINEGLGKGVLVPSADVYNFLGQSYYFSDQIEPAIAAWTKAAPLAKDGESYLNLATVLVQEGRYPQGKTAAQQALAKGVKKPGNAWMAIARAEFADDGKNRTAILAAYKEAAKYPETKAQASKAIAQMSR